MSGTLNLHFQKEFLVPPPQVQENWSSTGPGGKQVKCKLKAIASWKNKGVTGDHVVFSSVSRRAQPLQHRKHPAFRYEGTKDPTRLSPEAMAYSEAIRRCCKVLDNFDKSLKLPVLFWAFNPPEKTRVSAKKHRRVLVDKVFDLLTNRCLFCSKILRHGIACLRLLEMLLLMIAKNEWQLLELCCKERFLVLMLASKNMIFFNCILFASAFLFGVLLG